MGDEKLPWMKFNVSDWLSDMQVRAMDPSVRGIYIDLLAFDWQEDGVPDDPEFLARALGVDADAMRNAYGALTDRFVPHPRKDGHVTNRRINRERQKIREEHKKRSEAARKAARARWDKEKSNGNRAGASDSQSDRMPRASGSGSTSGSTSPGEKEREEKGCADWMHDDWHEALGSGRRIKLTPKRRQKYEAMHDEHLSDAEDPRQAWRAILWAVTESDYHMSDRSYQMPESLLRNAERRDTWIERTVEAIESGGVPDADRKAHRRRKRMAEEMERRRTA